MSIYTKIPQNCGTVQVLTDRAKWDTATSIDRRSIGNEQFSSQEKKKKCHIHKGNSSSTHREALTFTILIYCKYCP